MNLDESLRISKGQMVESLKRSGYLLEARVEQVIAKFFSGGYVETNSTYPDPYTGKPRELDIFAIRGHAFSNGLEGGIGLNIVSECINNSHPMVFLTKSVKRWKDSEFPYIKMSGVPIALYSRKRSKTKRYPLLADLEIAKFHHYCTGQIATQYCTFSKKHGKDTVWMASHHEEHFDAFGKLVAATEYFLDRHYKDLRNLRGPIAVINFYYPVLVMQGHMYEAMTTKRSVKLRRVEHVQYRYLTMRGNQFCPYQIDVVTEKHLPKYLAVIQSEFLTIKAFFESRSKQIGAAARQEYKKLTGRTPSSYRVQLEFKYLG